MRTRSHSLGPAAVLLGATCLAVDAAAQLGALYPRPSPVQSSAAVAVAADFDGDGATDLATAGGSVLVHRGLGGPRYAAPVTVAGGVGASCLLAVDVSGDGALDLLMANPSLDTVTVLRGDGDGGFPVRSDHAVADAPTWLAVGDMNEDGRLDVLTANSGADSVSLLLADGLGGFAGAVNVGVYKSPRCLDLGDFNADGHLDIATANYTYPSTITVRLGDGRGGFGPKNTFTAATAESFSTDFLVVDDFDGDGHADLLVTFQQILFLHRGLGDGTFAAPMVAVSPSSSPVVLADLNGDGLQDVLGTAVTASGLAVSLSATAVPPPGERFSASASSTLSVADLDADGDLDALTTSTSTGSVTVHLGDGAGSFDELPAWTVNGYPAVDFALADLDGDGDDDAVTVQKSGITGVAHSLAVLLQDGTGFGAATYHPFEPNEFPLQWEPRDLAAGDLTGDGRADVAVVLSHVVAPFLVAVRVFVSDGAGGLVAQPDVTLPEAFDGYLHLEIGPLDGDALADAVVSYQAGFQVYRASVLRSTGGGGLQLLPSFALVGAPSALRLADLTLDDRLDLVVGGFLPSGPVTYTLQTLLGDGAGGFLPGTLVYPSFGVYGIVAGDVDEDGLTDVVIGESPDNSGWVATYSGDGAGGLMQAFSKTPFVAPLPGAGDPSALIDVDGDGHLDLVASDHGYATVLRGAGTGAFDDALHHAVGAFLSPLPTDLDGDGLVDLVVLRAIGGLTALTHLPPTPWLDLGNALAAGAGPAPSLVALSPLTSGAPISLSIASGKPNGSATLVIGAAAIFAPFKGGTLVPLPSLLVPGLPLDIHGHFVAAGLWYTGLPPGTEFYFQAWIPDAAGPHGFTATEALKGTTP